MLMKWLIRLAFPALGLLLLLIFFGLGDPEKVAEPVRNAETPETLPPFEGLVPSPAPTNGPDIVFKWKDTDGHWHYADQPPAQGQWNALAIERSESASKKPPSAGAGDDWQTPYSAPFSLNSPAYKRES
ncbi:MAG: DUF4124 domain-containing protein [Marinobacter sp.]|uniref:DUF4124 domain-containing protein n=1 Tax=unclassified Marinobacter TaxID=83889 RepID=UPI00273CDDC4|nr:DUF4124 domain-containing protein [Marinobacter sp. MDS2]MDP4548121.1 DUF4124 domain-containing protein [Marinobacter sp. MDS2]